ncbi:MAG: hypothetical protein E7546_07680 [Ruminococcaceae bacterium]|nr:hypothetical protein [Oscillospiraceae bacterium]
MKDRKHILKLFAPVLCILLFFCLTACNSENNAEELSQANTTNIFTVRNASRRLAVSDGRNTYFACGIGETLVDPSQDKWVNEWSIGVLDSEGNSKGILYAHIPAGEELFICDNRIFYKAVDDSRLMCIKTDGNSPVETVMDSGCLRIIGIFDNDLFYIGTDTETIFRLSLHSLESAKLTDCDSLFPDINTDFSEDNLLFSAMVEDRIYLSFDGTDCLTIVSAEDGSSSNILTQVCSQNESFIPLCATSSELYYAISSSDASNSKKIYQTSFDCPDDPQELNESLGNSFLNGYFIIDEWLYYGCNIADASFFSEHTQQLDLRRINLGDPSQDFEVIENLFLSDGRICPLSNGIIYHRRDTGEFNICRLSGEDEKFLWY